MLLFKTLFNFGSSETVAPPQADKRAELKTRRLEETLGRLEARLRNEQFQEVPALLRILTKNHRDEPHINAILLAVLRKMAEHDAPQAFKAGIQACWGTPYEHPVREVIGAKLLDICAGFPLSERVDALREIVTWTRDAGEVSQSANYRRFELIDELRGEDAISLAGRVADHVEGDFALERQAVDKWLNLVRQQPLEEAFRICLSTPAITRGGFYEVGKQRFPKREEKLIDKTAASELKRLAAQLDPEMVIFVVREMRASGGNEYHKASSMGMAIASVLADSEERVPAPLPRSSVVDFMARLWNPTDRPSSP